MRYWLEIKAFFEAKSFNFNAVLFTSEKRLSQLDKRNVNWSTSSNSFRWLRGQPKTALVNTILLLACATRILWKLESGVIHQEPKVNTIAGSGRLRKIHFSVKCPMLRTEFHLQIWMLKQACYMIKYILYINGELIYQRKPNINRGDSGYICNCNTDTGLIK